MANVKKIIVHTDTSSTVYCIIERETDTFLLNDVDGSFAAAPADPYLSLTEDGTVKGKYAVSESRTVWADGKYITTAYKQAGGSPAPISDAIIGTGELVINNDREVFLDLSINDAQRTLFTLIESQRGSHSGEGEIIFWDAANVTGNASDANSGLTYNEPKLTYNFNGAGGVHSLLVNNGHQIIKGISGPVPGPVTVNEYVEIDTAYTFLRCDGRDWLFEATHLETCAVKSSAEGVEFSGFRVKSRATGNQDAICATGDFTRIKSIQIDYSRGSGIVINNASHCILDDFVVQDAAVSGVGHAVHIVGDISLTTRNMVKSGRIFGNTTAATDGIRIDGAFCSHNFIVGSDPYGVLIHNNSGWGINEVAGANHTIIVGPRVHVSHNDLGTHSLTGVGSTIENYDQWGREGADGDTLETLSDQIDPLPTGISTLLANVIVSEKVDTLLDINKPLNLTVGTTTRLEYQWLDLDGVAVDVSLLTFTLKAVKNAGEVSPAIPEITGVIQDGPNGRWYFDVLPATVFKGRYESWATDGSAKITPLTMAGGARIETHPRL